MFKRNELRLAIAAAFLFAAAPAQALVVNEEEPVGVMGVNDSLNTPQRLPIGPDGSVTVNGRIGITSTSPTLRPIPDVDFYAFEGKGGDGVKLNIDRGMKGELVTAGDDRHVNTILAIFKPGTVAGTWERFGLENDVPTPDAGSPKEAGGLMDARIPADDTKVLRLPVPGTATYIVGVSSFNRSFRSDGSMTSTSVSGAWSNGSYKLIISGVTPPNVMHLVSIEIKPGNGDEAAPLNPKSKGNVPIALLSHRATDTAPEFKALEVKRDSITFGRTGTEKSLVRCNKEGSDVNGDGLLDLICHFANEDMGWNGQQFMGAIKGMAGDGRRFEGTGDLKIVPRDSSN